MRKNGGEEKGEISGDDREKVEVTKQNQVEENGKTAGTKVYIQEVA